MQFRLSMSLLLIVTLLSPCVHAQIYRYTDSNGVVTYSDQPQQNAETITLAKPNISKTTSSVQTEGITKQETKPADSSKKEVIKKPYTQFFIESPENQQTFHNQTEFTIVTKINPPLQTGDTIQFFMDGKAITNPEVNSSTVIYRTTNNEEILTRGTHHLHAVILDKKNQIIKKTPTITIYLHYAHVGSRER